MRSLQEPRTKRTLVIVFLLFSFFPLGHDESLATEKYRFGETPLSPAEYQKYLQVPPMALDALEELNALDGLDGLPSTYDARNEGLVTPAKKQGNCAACWAFASVAALESHLLKHFDIGFVDLSEQSLISCNTWNNHGDPFGGCCNGNSGVIQRMQDSNQGPIYEDCFPYVDSEFGSVCPPYSSVPCSDCEDCSQLDYRVMNFHTIDTTNPRNVKTSIYNDGPSYFRYDVYSDFLEYWDGDKTWPNNVYVHQSGEEEGGHAVLVFGWDDDLQAYLCKNSWGDTGGPFGDGTFLMAYSGHNTDLGFGLVNFNIVAIQETIGGSGFDYGESVQQTRDGGYIIAGYTDSIGAGLFDVYLIKTDVDRNKLWEKTFGGGGNDRGYSVQQTSDGGYIIAGYTDSVGAGMTDVYLIKTSVDGEILWEKTFGGSQKESGYSVQQTSDGGYIIAGYTRSPSLGAADADVYLVKTDIDGEMLWEKTFGGRKKESGESVQQTSDGGYIIAGYTDSVGAGMTDVYLIKTDVDGEILWEKTFGGDGNDRGYSVQQTSDGGYIIAGYTDSIGAGMTDVYIIKTDVDGEILWEKTFGGDGNDRGYSVQQTSDGGYIIAGYTRSPSVGTAGMMDVYLIKTDVDGQMLWENTFGGQEHDRGYSIQQTSDGGYIITGNTESIGAGATDVYLIKTEDVPSSNGSCTEQLILSGISDEGRAFDGNYVVWITSDLHEIYRTPILNLTPGAPQLIDQFSGDFVHVGTYDPIVAWNHPNGYGDIWMKNMNTGVLTNLTNDGANQWSPRVHTNWIVWMDESSGNWDINVYNLSTGLSQLLGSTADDVSPRIHGDLVVWESRISETVTEIRLYDLSASEYVDDIPIEIPGYQSSPDIFGNTIVWTDGRSGNSDIYGWTIGANEEFRITDEPEIQFGPRIHGDLVIWNDYRNGNGDIYGYWLSTGQEIQITSSLENDTNPDTDGQVIIWNRIISDTTADLYGMNLAPEPDFLASTLNGIKPLTVDFTDLSTCTVTDWAWDFDNDGTTDSTAQSPTHIYDTVGIYTVKLTVTGPGGTRDGIWVDYINVTDSPTPDPHPVIDKLYRRSCEPGDAVAIIGSGFGDGSPGDYIRLGTKEMSYDYKRIKLWSDTKIRVITPKNKYVKDGCAWFQGADSRKIKVWVNVGGTDSNEKRLTLVKNPADCLN